MIDVMARKVSVVTTDDLDGSPEAAIVSFGLDGVSYEIDLAAANKTRLANLVAPADHEPIPAADGWLQLRHLDGPGCSHPPGTMRCAGCRSRTPFTAASKRPRRMASPALAVQDVIDALDSFYCHNVVAALWADAVANRLEGLAIYLLSEELPKGADHARAAARRLAGRIGEAAGSPATPGSSSTAHRARTSSRSPTARTRGRSPPTRCGVSTSSSRRTRPSWTWRGDGMT